MISGMLITSYFFLCTIYNPAVDPHREKLKQNYINYRKPSIGNTFCTAILCLTTVPILTLKEHILYFDCVVKNDYDLQGRTRNRETLKMNIPSRNVRAFTIFISRGRILFGKIHVGT